MRLLIIPILVFLTYEIFARESFCEKEQDCGLYPHDSVCYWIGPYKLGIGDGDTITYRPGYTIKLPKNVISWISGRIEIFKLTNEQYIYVKPQEYSIHNTIHEINDTIYIPDDKSIILFIDEYNSLIMSMDYSLEAVNNDSTIYSQYQQYDSLVREYRYLNNLITRYDSLNDITLDKTRESRFIIKDGYTILLFNFIPSEIETAISIIRIIKHKENQNIKQWKSKLIKTIYHRNKQ